MQSFPLAVIEAVADSMFGLQDVVFRQFGELGPPALMGVTVRDGKIKSVTEVRLSGDIRERLAKELRRVQAEFDLAVVAIEAWTAPPDAAVRPIDHPLRKECVNVTIYSKDATYSLFCDIARNPSPHLIKGELAEVESFTGKLAPDGGVLSETNAPSHLHLLHKLLANRPPGWKHVFLRSVQAFFAASLVRGLAQMASDPLLPQESLDFAHRAIEAQIEYLDPIPGISGPQRWLVASYLRIDMENLRAAKPSAAIKEALSLVVEAYERFAEKEGRFEVLRRGKPVFVFTQTPPWVIFNCAVEHLAITLGLKGDAAEQLQAGQHGQIIQAEADVYLASVDKGKPGPMFIDVLVLGLCDLPDASGPPENSTALPWRPPELSVALDVQKKLFSAAVVEVNGKQPLQLECLDVMPAFDAVRRVNDEMQGLELSTAAMVAKHWRFGDMVAPREVLAEVTVVQFQEPGQERAMVTLWTDKHEYLMLAEAERAPHESFPEFAEDVCALLRQAGIKDVRQYPRMLVAPQRKRDPGSGAPLVPDFQGGWVAQDKLPAPGHRA